MALKTPISILQELVVSRKEAFPQYTFESVGDLLNPQFRCTVTVSSVTVVAYARNKKDAKQKAADNALQQLQKLSAKISTEQNQGIPMEKLDSANNISIAPCSVWKECPEYYCDGVNYVGQLNEYVEKTKCAMGVRYVDSIALGSNLFEMTCLVGMTRTVGYAMNKKQAKQKAACEMLKNLKSSRGTLPVSSDISRRDELDKKALAKFSELSISQIIPVKDVKKDVEPSESIEIKEYGLKEAKEKFESLGLTYTLKTLQETPFIVVAQIDGKPITTVGVGDDKDNATICAMNKALHALSVGCSFT